jgi:hypothetical protein
MQSHARQHGSNSKEGKKGSGDERPKLRAQALRPKLQLSNFGRRGFHPTIVSETISHSFGVARKTSSKILGQYCAWAEP